MRLNGLDAKRIKFTINFLANLSNVYYLETRIFGKLLAWIRSITFHFSSFLCVFDLFIQVKARFSITYCMYRTFCCSIFFTFTVEDSQCRCIEYNKTYIFCIQSTLIPFDNQNQIPSFFLFSIFGVFSFVFVINCFLKCRLH